MSKNSEKNRFMSVLAGISFVADVLTLAQFILTGNVLQFWTFRWIISIGFIFGFFWAGVGLLKLGQSHKSADHAMALFGLGYLMASLIVFICMCISQASGNLLFGDYIGFAVLLGVSFFFGNLSTSIVNRKLLKFPSYGYGLTSLLFAILLVAKYVFFGHFFDWAEFAGEIVLLIAGSAIFIQLYVSSRMSDSYY